MAKIKINRFGGVIPRYVGTLLRENMASHASNVKLYNGALEPFRMPKQIKEVPDAHIKTLHRLRNCCWLTFDKPCVNIAEWLPTCERVYVTGTHNYPVVSFVDKDNCHLDYKRVGLPIPNPPTVVYSSLEVTDKTSSARAYVYTYVNSFNEEGPPSLATPVVTVDAAVTATITFPEPPPGWDIKAIRIYRLAHTFIDGTQSGQELHSDYFYVGQIASSQRKFTDHVPDNELVEALVSHQYTPPPAGLKNIVALTDGVLAGSIGNQVWFSEPYQPQAWPVDYMLSLDDDVRALTFSNGVLYALTDGHPYAISEQLQQEQNCRQVKRMPKSAPIVSGKSSVAVPNGVVYACNDGLMLVSANNMSLLTGPWYSKDDWQALLPHQMIGAMVQGQYMGVTCKGSFLFDIRDGVENDGISDNDLMPLTLMPNALFTDRDGTLYMAFGNVIHEWDAGNTYLPYTWRSRINDLPGLHNMSCAKVRFSHHAEPNRLSSGVRVTHYADGRVLLKRQVTQSKAYRLPAKGRYFDVEIEVNGTESVREIELATSMSELAGV